MADRREKPPADGSDKARARQARQAEALRRNLARRKAQARSRAGEPAQDRAEDKDPSGA